MPVNFAVVKMAHQTWRLKLRSFLDGTESIDTKDLTSHRDCGLGKWIYSSETMAFASLPDFVELEKKHKSMHQLVKQVVDLKHIGRVKEAQQEFLKVKDSANEVVTLISKVEEKVNGQ
jgi:methyl-accepting chemotaxis protein